MKPNLLLILLLIISCHSNPAINYDDIIGTWTSEYGADSSFEALDLTTFTENDSVIAESSIKGERSRISTGKYSINKVDGSLVIKTDSYESTSKILDLNRQSLVLQIQNPKGKWRLKRLK